MEKIPVQMLGLKLPTDPRWVDLAEITLEAVLSDHAYCEQKATSYCISLIQQYPERTDMVNALAPIVTEEWGHFRMVLAELKRRNLTLLEQRKDYYVNQLKEFRLKGGSKNDRFIDKLLQCALIEARSCERFRLLSLHLKDEKLKSFYHKFMVSEAGHYRMFLDLAYQYGEKEKVKARWEEYLVYEQEIMNNMELRGDRIH